MVLNMEIGMITSPVGLAAGLGDGATDGYSLIGYSLFDYPLIGHRVLALGDAIG